MKKIIFIAAISVCSFIIACKKDKSLSQEEYIAENAPVTIPGKNGILVTASDVYSLQSKFRRKIQIEDTKTNTKLPPVFMTFESYDTENIYKKFKTDPSSISGIFLVETGGQIIYREEIINGKAQKGERISYKVRDPFYNPKVQCTVATIHNCVSWEIEDMNWIEYGACLVGAPACYATLWASCTWEVCHNRMQYTNPIK